MTSLRPLQSTLLHGPHRSGMQEKARRVPDLMSYKFCVYAVPQLLVQDYVYIWSPKLLFSFSPEIFKLLLGLQILNSVYLNDVL